MADFATRRQENIKQNELLLKEIKPVAPARNSHQPKPHAGSKIVKRKASPPQASIRKSKRIAEASTRPVYSVDSETNTNAPSRRTSGKAKSKQGTNKQASASHVHSGPHAESNIDAIIAGWMAWEPEASEPIRDASGTFHFESHADFRPNKSPEEIIREGSFGGSYWRPLLSNRLRVTVQDDWKELPASWTAGLDINTYLTNSSYNPEVNKYSVACGQSIEEWEASGWIAHEYDVRGWFQWYCRFWMGRRCADDERQISRWKKCVGESGRWRRILLKKYVKLGIRTVFSDDDGDGEDAGDVSPVVHQTCHHWAYEVRQDALDQFWAEGK